MKMSLRAIYRYHYVPFQGHGKIFLYQFHPTIKIVPALWKWELSGKHAMNYHMDIISHFLRPIPILAPLYS